MKTDMPEAALRLSSTLPCRTHYAQEPAPGRGGNRTPYKQRGNAKRKHVKTGLPRGYGSGGKNARAIIINGVRYANMMLAMRALKCGNSRLYKMLERGEAKRG